MSISFFSSTSLRNSSTTQNFMNDLASQWNNWDHVVYDTTDSTLVKELWVTSEIYIYLDGTSIKIKHNTRTANTTFYSYASSLWEYHIVVTDKGVMAYMYFSGNYGRTILIAKTSDNEYGVVVNDDCTSTLTSRSMTHKIFTDDMRTSSVSGICPGTSNTASSVELIQLIDIVSVYDTVKFEGAYCVYITPPNIGGRTVINDKNYYIMYNAGLALEYSAT